MSSTESFFYQDATYIGFGQVSPSLSFVAKVRSHPPTAVVLKCGLHRSCIGNVSEMQIVGPPRRPREQRLEVCASNLWFNKTSG